MSFKTALVKWQMNRCKKRIKRYRDWMQKEKNALKELEQEQEFDRYLKNQRNKPRPPLKYLGA